MNEVQSSTHKVEIVKVKFEVHPNADKLLIGKVFGYSCVVGKNEWAPLLVDNICLCAYICPDSTVDVRKPEFSFLADQAKQDGRARIKAKKLRGIVSFGLLVLAPEGSKEGDNVAELLGVEHYEPPLPGDTGNKKRLFMGGEVASAPSVFHVKYDVDAFRRYNFLFVEGEEVMCTEKIDGANSRIVFHDGKMFCGSRTEWKKEFPNYDHLSVEFLTNQGMEEEKAKAVMDRLLSSPKKKNLWWDLLEKTPALEKFCRDNPEMIVYAEAFGHVNRIKYNLPEGNRYAAFDILYQGKWVDAIESRDKLEQVGVPVVPLLTETKTIPYSFDTICALAEGKSLVSGCKVGTIREGVVVKPVKERYDERVGRVNFKAVSSEFLEKY